jgi:hypothetical protein
MSAVLTVCVWQRHGGIGSGHSHRSCRPVAAARQRRL